MLSTACPRCGRPSPLSLATPDRMACLSCGYAGAVPPEAQAQLHAAGQILHSMRARDRQLSAQQQRALGSTRSAALGYWLVTAAVSLPSLACAGFGALATYGSKRAEPWFIAASLAPIVLFAIAAIGGFRWVQRRYAKLAITCAAIPPAAPGQPAGCHVCGAPLAIGSTMVVRCAHCAADNVVAPAVLAAAERQRATQVSGFESIVRREATMTRTVARQATLAILVSAVGAPFFTFVVMLGIAMVLSLTEGPFDPAYRLGLVTTPGGKCIAHVYPRKDGKWLLGFGSNPPAGMKSIEVRDSVDDLPAMTAADFTGKRVRAADDGRPPAGVITRVYSTGLGSQAGVVAGTGYSLEGVCLDEP